MGVTFLYLVTRYYGDKNSTNTSQRIRPCVFRSSLCSVVLRITCGGEFLWVDLFLSCHPGISFAGVKYYFRCHLWSTLSSGLFIDSYQWTTELLYSPESQCSPSSTVSLFHRTQIAGGVICLLTRNGSFIVSFIQWWLEASSNQCVLPKGMFNHHDCTAGVRRLPPKPSSP